MRPWENAWGRRWGVPERHNEYILEPIPWSVSFCGVCHDDTYVMGPTMDFFLLRCHERTWKIQ